MKHPLALIVVLLCSTLLTSYPASARTNTQFAQSDAQTLTIENDGLLPKTVYARFVFPDSEPTRNTGFVQTILPGRDITYWLPAGTIIYACDGKYWDDYTPAEMEIGTLEEGEHLTLTTDEFTVDD